MIHQPGNSEPLIFKDTAAPAVFGSLGFALNSTGFRILVVDDESVTRLRLAHLLEYHDYEVVTAENGLEAVKLIKQEKFDLILTDINMPVMNGFRLLRMLRQMYNQIELPAVVMTSSDGNEQVLDAFDNGANDYIQKPFDNEVVIARIQNLLMIKNAQKALRESEERYALATRGTNDGIWDWNLVTGDLYLSQRWLEMVGKLDSTWQPKGDEWMQLIHPDDHKRVLNELESHLCGRTEYFETELRMQSGDNEYRWMLCRGLAVHDDDGMACRIAGSLTDITEGKVADALTGLPNRILFRDRISRCVEILARHPDRPFAVIYIDVDDFKMINDQLGHDAGDEFLVNIANRLESTLRKSEAVVARLGGDEFAILLENAPSKESVIAVVERVHQQLSQPFKAGSQQIITRGSMGIVVANDSLASKLNQRITTELLLSQADTAMYRAKKQHDTPYCIFDPAMIAENRFQLELGMDLQNAIGTQQIQLRYCPIVSLAGRKTVGFQATLCWNHPKYGWVSPDTFLPIAESKGLMEQLGSWALEESSRTISNWSREFDKQLILSLNVSVRHFMTGQLSANLPQVLLENELQPQQLQLAIPETVLGNQESKVTDNLNEIHSMGIGLAIADFGTSHSPLAYLHKYPINIIKIDESFTRNMLKSQKDKAIVRCVFALAESVQLFVAAEGIETVEQVKQLEEFGCQTIQGPLCDDALPPEKAIETIHRSWEF